MPTTVRTLLSVCLLFGFLLLTLLFVLAAAGLGLHTLINGHEGQYVVSVIFVGIAYLLIQVVHKVQRRSAQSYPGVAVSEHDEPELWRTVREVAQRVDVRAPREIRLVPDVLVAVSEDTILTGTIATQRRLLIGLPLVNTLTREELRAALTHELGHYSTIHDRLGGLVYRGRIAYASAITGRRKGRTRQAAGVTRLYLQLYLGVSHGVARQQELDADALAVGAAGRTATADALRKARAYGPAWEEFMESYVAFADSAQARPDDLFGGFNAMVSDPHRQDQLAELAQRPEAELPYDAHPPLTERLAAIAHLPDTAAAPDPTPATALLRDPATAARAVEASLLTSRVRALPAVPWEQVVARGMYASTNQDPARDTVVAAQRILGTQHRTLDGVLEVLARRQAHQLHAELVRAGWQREPQLVALALQRTLEAALIDHHLATWTLLWAGRPRLLNWQGQEVDLEPTANALAADPQTQVPVLRQWLASSGIRPDYAPAAALPANHHPRTLG